jgi:lipopolysaccharide heptosyltransferase I
MPAPRILFVKLSSLGDVVHNLPAVSDLRQSRPAAHVAWAVEEAYAGLVSLHPGVDEVIPVAMRRLRRAPFDGKAWGDWRASRSAIANGRWDYVLDTQGLIKSAIVARRAHAPVFGLDAASARERLAARFYDVSFRVPRAMHAVERNRALAAHVFGHAIDRPARYGLVPPAMPPGWVPPRPYVVLLHAASHARKRWADERWIALGQILAATGYATILPGGTAEERAHAARLAAAIPDAIAAPATTIAEAAALLAHASHVAGVDTGLTHLAVALGRPTVGIYCATRPELTGLHGANAVNLGAPGAPPDAQAVAEALAYVPPAMEASGDMAPEVEASGYVPPADEDGLLASGYLPPTDKDAPAASGHLPPTA